MTDIKIQILHTDTFEPFWGDQRLAYTLSAKSLKRLKPNYKLIDQIPCPSPDDDAKALSSALENSTDQTVNSRNQPTTAKNKGKGGRGSRAAPAKTKGRAAPKKATTTATAAKRKKTTVVAQKAPKTAKAGAGNGKSNANANANANNTGVSTTVPATISQRTGRPIGKPPREAYADCMAQEDDLHIRGPTSDEEETTTDDDSFQVRSCKYRRHRDLALSSAVKYDLLSL